MNRSYPILEFAVLGEAVAAVHRPALCRFEGHLAGLSAVGTDCVRHVARGTIATAAAAASAESTAAATAAFVVVITHFFTCFF